MDTNFFLTLPCYSDCRFCDKTKDATLSERDTLGTSESRPSGGVWFHIIVLVVVLPAEHVCIVDHLEEVCRALDSSAA